jgi:Zn finger protein HypA/HybF involved in hydrogenase expression
MAQDASDLVLDGNAAGGRLRDFFVAEVTEAQIECQSCGYVTAVGTLALYGGFMGAVLRCPHCDGIVMRAVHTEHGRWLEMRGARYLRFASPE